MNPNAREIHRTTRVVSQVKLDDGTATLAGLVCDGFTGHRITGDGTLQHPLRVLPGPAIPHEQSKSDDNPRALNLWGPR